MKMNSLTQRISRSHALARSIAIAACGFLLTANFSSAQVFEPEPGRVVDYPGVNGGEPRQVAYDPYADNYMGVRLRRFGITGEFSLDQTHQPFPGIATRWYPLAAPAFDKKDLVDVAAVIPTPSGTFTLLNKQEGSAESMSAWIVRRNRDFVLGGQSVRQLTVGSSVNSVEILDGSYASGRIYILSRGGGSTFGREGTFVTALSSAGSVIWSREIVFGFSTKFDGIEAEGNHVYLTGSSVNGSLLTRPIVVRVTGEGTIGAAMGYANLYSPFLGRQPSLIFGPGGFPQLVTLDGQLRPVVVPINPTNLTPVGMGRSIVLASNEAAFLRDAVMTSEFNLHLLFGANLNEETVGPTSTQVLITGTATNELVGGGPAKLFTLIPELEPRGAYLVSSGPVVAVGGTAPNQGTEVGPLRLFHSVSDTDGYPSSCSFADDSVTSVPWPVSRFSLSANATPVTATLVEQTSQRFGTRSFQNPLTLCE